MRIILKEVIQFSRELILTELMLLEPQQTLIFQEKLIL